MGKVIVDQGVLALALQALRRDAERGQTVRGEIADEIEKSCADLLDEMLQWRGIYKDEGDAPCAQCSGSGVKSYSNTATWRGGCGGQAITSDVCDACWGSGNAGKPWATLRKLKAAAHYQMKGD